MATGKTKLRTYASPQPSVLPDARAIPNWAPKTLKDDYAQGLSRLVEMEARPPDDWPRSVRNNVGHFLGGQRGRLDFLHKLLTHVDMRSVWATIEGKGATQNVPDAAKDFFNTCMFGMGFHQRKTKAQRSREKKRLISTLRKVSLQLESMEDMSISGVYSVLRDCGFIDPSLKTVLFGSGEKLNYIEVEYPDSQAEAGLFLPVGPTMSEFIDAFATYLEDKGKDRSREDGYLLSVTKPRAANAPRTYFALVLTDYLQTTYGDPLPVVVSATTNVLFDDGHSYVTPRHVSTLAQKILKKKS